VGPRCRILFTRRRLVRSPFPKLTRAAFELLHQKTGTSARRPPTSCPPTHR
jgi:hypothetical protein